VPQADLKSEKLMDSIKHMRKEDIKVSSFSSEVWKWCHAAS
jgi:hypothetical protein